MGRYTKKVGLIISDPRSSSFSEVIIENIKNYFKKRAQTNTRKVVILHPDATSLSITRRIAEAVFIHQVGALAGGESYNEAWVLHTWAEKLRIPTFILYPNIATEQEPKHSFFISPSPNKMAKAFEDLFKVKRAKNIAILAPANKPNRMIRKLIKNTEGTLHFEQYSYFEHDFNSLKVAVAELLKINDESRRDELELLLELEVEKAKQEDRKPDPGRVMLPAKMDYDAVIIADHFKNVRHLVGLLKFYNSPQPLLVGTQQWRAPELLSPKEDMLEGAYFIDYVGNFNELPFNIRVNSSQAGLFAEQSGDTDLKLLANFCSELMELIFQDPLSPRFQTYRKIEALAHSDNKNFFSDSKIFNEDHESNWPVFTFKVVNQLIQVRYQTRK